MLLLFYFGIIILILVNAIFVTLIIIIIIVNNWVRALVTLKNPPEQLITDPTTKITKAKTFDHKLEIKEILFSSGFSKDANLAQQENPSKLPPTQPDADGIIIIIKNNNYILEKILVFLRILSKCTIN